MEVPVSVKLGQIHGGATFCFRNQVKEVITPAVIHTMIERDFSEMNLSDDTITYEDQLFISRLSDGVHKRIDGKY